MPSSPALPVKRERAPPTGSAAIRSASARSAGVAGAARAGLRRDPLLVALGRLVGEALRAGGSSGRTRASPAPARRPCRGSSCPRAGSLRSSVVSSGGRRRSRRRKSSQVSASPSSVSPPRTNGSSTMATSASAARTRAGDPPADERRRRPAPEPRRAHPRPGAGWRRATAQRPGRGQQDQREPEHPAPDQLIVEPEAGNGAGGGPSGRSAMRWYQAQARRSPAIAGERQQAGVEQGHRVRHRRHLVGQLRRRRRRDAAQRPPHRRLIDCQVVFDAACTCGPADAEIRPSTPPARAPATAGGRERAATAGSTGATASGPESCRIPAPRRPGRTAPPRPPGCWSQSARPAQRAQQARPTRARWPGLETSSSPASGPKRNTGGASSRIARQEPAPGPSGRPDAPTRVGALSRRSP